jgi:hypothetical protein
MRHSIFRFIQLLIAFAFIVIVALRTQPASAQTEVTQLAELAVELWPDYDRPAVLVLLTGTLPADVALPATLTLPLPPDADVHAVASFNEAGALMSDVDYSAENGLLTLTTPANRFRVEYYTPYTVDGSEYTFTFDWTSGLAIDEMATVVQQPLAATDIRITPAPAGSAARDDGLTYHTLPARAVGAGEPVTVEVAYTVEAPVLSAPSQDLTATTAVASPTEETSAAGIGISPWWLLAAAGALILIGGAWFLGQRQGRAASRGRKPRPTRPAKPDAPRSAAPPPKTAATRYCHNCGQPAQPGDAFCRNCGTQLK